MGKLKDIEKGIYTEAREKGVSVTELIRQQSPDCEADLPSDAFLERARLRSLRLPVPDDLRTGLDAFELQLLENDIRVSGREASLVESFYRTTAGDGVLFPEFINREVRIGMMLGRNQCQLDDIVASSQSIDAVTYKTIKPILDDSEVGARAVGEGGEFPSITIQYGIQSITLMKFGHEIKSTYEVIRRMSIPSLTVHLRKVGRRLAKTRIAEAISILINGDGNDNAAEVITKSGLTWDNIVDFDMEWDDSEATVWVGDKATVGTLMKLAEFKDPQAGFNYQKTGKLIDPLGVTLRKNSSMPANSLLGVDQSAALEEIKEQGSNLTESDKIIDKQFERIVISEVSGFAKIYQEATMLLDYSS